MRMKIVCSDAVSDRAEMWSKVVSEFKVGDKLTKTVGKVSDIYGVFFELLPGFDPEGEFLIMKRRRKSHG